MEETKIYGLTNPQRSIWLTEQFYSDTMINNICVSGTIYEDINIELLKEAINETIKQNDAFRIRLSIKNDVPVQSISDFEKFDIDVIKVSNEDDIKKIENEEVKYKFDVINSNLYRFKIASLNNNCAAVILTAHHIIADSWSLGLTIQEILRNYHALMGVSDFEKTTSSYIDYIKSEEEYKKSKKFQKDKTYWNEMFSSIPEQVTLPNSKSNLPNFSYNAKRLNFSLDSNLLKFINEFCIVNKISLFTFFMSVYAIYVARVSNIDDLVLGTPILNRTNSKEKHTMGMFVNTVPIRINYSNNLTFKEFTNIVAKNIMDALRHQKYSYNTILDDLRSKNKNIPNLYNVALSYQITKAFNQSFGNYKTNWTFNNYCANDFNIHIFDINDTGSLIVSYDYLIDKYSENEVIAIQNRIIHIVEQILSNPDIECNNIDIVTPDEKHQILNVFNNTSTEYPRDKTIVDLFEEQVNKFPNNVAIVFENKQITYKELNEKANKLARYLQDCDVKSQDKVIILADKSIDMYVSIIAILKLGALYVPVDSEYPEERIKIIIEDCKPKIIIVDNKYKNLVQDQKLCIIPLQNLEKYKSTNLENHIMARRWCIYNIHFWFYRKAQRSSCTT